jgi:cell division protein FtsW
MARKLTLDRWLFLTIVALVGIGLVAVHSASAPVARVKAGNWNPFFWKQVLAVVVGAAGLWVALHIDYRRLRDPLVAFSFVAFALALLGLVLLAPEVNGTRRWLFFGGISFQPVEFAKLALIVLLAQQLERKHDRVNQRELLGPIAATVATMACLTLLQPDLGSAVLLLLTAGTVLFLAGLSWTWILTGVGALLPTFLVVALAAPYRRARLLAFLHPERDPLGSGFQALQSLIAVGSGGLFGLGPGGSIQKLYFLPYPHSDFIFSIIAEEWGFVGAFSVLALFGVLCWRGLRASWRAPDFLGRYLGFGCVAVIVLQALLHISVALALLPTKGIPLPFISYGGTAMVVSLVTSGLLLNVSQHGA